MKKIIMILLFLSLTLYESSAQNISSDFYERVYPIVLETCVQSPVIHNLFSYKEYPVHHSIGRVEIQIPIYNLMVNSLTLPLGLSYNSSGIKIQDNPGIIGYGWSLNNEFKISRSIRGKDDLEFPVIQHKILDFWESTLVDSDYWRKVARLAPEDIHNKPYLYDTEKMDGQFDIFSIELPNLRVTFFIEKQTDGTYSAYLFEPAPLSIKLLTTNKVKTNGSFISHYTDLYGIEVTDDNGIRYLFGESEQRDGVEQYTEYNGSGVATSMSKTGWMLREIIESPPNIIYFTYKDAIDYPDFQPQVKTSVQHHNFQIRDSEVASQNDLLILRGDIHASNLDENNISYRMNLIAIRERNEGKEQNQLKPMGIKSKLIKTISNSSFELEFNYDSISKLGAPEAIPDKRPYHRHNISNLKIFSKADSSRQVKIINFYSHEGFLDSINISGNGMYKFSYDRRDRDFTTEQLHKAIDWWGYCNGKNNISSLPLDDSNGTAASKRDPDSLFTKVRSLERITYPTGGNVKINYGTHRLRDGAYGAGLRVESLETSDPSSGMTTIKKFKYENPRYTGIPYAIDNYHSSFCTHLFAGKDLVQTLAGTPTYMGNVLAYEVDIATFSTYTFPVVHTPYTSFPVWYENVTEENEEGKIEYKFEYTPFERDGPFREGTRNNTMYDKEPVLVEQRVFVKNTNGGFNLVKSVKNSYQRIFFSLFEVNIINGYQEVSSAGGVYRRGTYYDMPDYNPPRSPARSLRAWAIGNVTLDSSIEITYLPNDSTRVRVLYLYDTERPYNLIAKNTYMENNDIINQRYFYSNHVLPVCEGVASSDHGLIDCETHKSTVIRQETRRNNTFITSNMTYFTTVNSTQKVLKERYFSGPNGVMEKREEYRTYDHYGNPVEIVKDKHSHMVRLWSYHGMYPVAEIKNATYEQVRDVLRGLLFLLPLSPSLSDGTWSRLNNLRSTPSLKNAMITTYKYKPLVGLIEMIDPRGISTYYDYDDHGRLIEVYILENGSKKLLQENEYKYYNDLNEQL